MRLFPAQQSREDYLATQIRRSNSKFNYCKVSIHDVNKYWQLLHHTGSRPRPAAPVTGPIVCLGTRNGREVDLFRLRWFGAAPLRQLAERLERRTHSFTTWVPALESAGRSDVLALTRSSVIGVEVNPRAARRDVWIGSFDEMPAEWTDTFGVLYSNAFDQSADPERTARDWKRIMKPGGFIVFCYSNNADPTPTDPVGGLCLEDVQALFGGRLLYFHDRGSRNGYSEVVLQL
jgi:hypothetical protein